MTTTRGALLLSFGERYSTVAVYAVSNVVLSRLLTPHDTGLFTLGFALTVMIGTFRDFGVGTYVIQEPVLTDAKWRSALGVSAVTSVLVLAAVVVAAILAGRVYRDPEVTAVMVVSGLTLLLIPFNALILAWLRRELNYGALYRISLAGVAVQSLVTIGLAWAGYGAMSMAWGSVANAAATLIGSIHQRPRQFGYRPSLAAWRAIAGLGLYSTVAALCNELTQGGGDVFLGRFAGFAAVGQFSKGGSLVAFVSQGLTGAALPVALSFFARKRRAAEPLDEAFPHALLLLTGLTWPAFAGLGVVAGPAIGLLFGPQWRDAVAPANLLAATAAVASITALHAMVYQATGAMRPRMALQLAVTPVQLLILFISAQGSLVQMAAGVTVNAVIECVPSQLVVNRLCGTSMHAIVRALLPSLAVTATTLLPAAGTLATLRAVTGSPFLLLAGAGLAGVGGWAVGLAATRHPLGLELVVPLRAGWHRFGVIAQKKRW